MSKSLVKLYQLYDKNDYKDYYDAVRNELCHKQLLIITMPQTDDGGDDERKKTDKQQAVIQDARNSVINYIYENKDADKDDSDPH